MGAVADRRAAPSDEDHLPEVLLPLAQPLLSLQDLSRIGTSVNRQAPFGLPDWQTMIESLFRYHIANSKTYQYSV